MSYILLDDLKTYLGITETVDDDTFLTSLIARAQGMIETRCKRVLYAAADTTRYFDAVRDVSDDLRTLYLDTDLCAITSVTNGDGTTVTSGQYVTEPRNYKPWYALYLRDSASISWTYSTSPENAITIIGRFAYATAVPADIAHINIRLAAYLYRQKDNSSDGTGDRPIMTASGTVLLPTKLANDFYEITEPYIRMQP